MVQDYSCRFNIHACIYLELFILFHPEIKYAELLIIQYLTLMDIGYDLTDTPRFTPIIGVTGRGYPDC